MIPEIGPEDLAAIESNMRRFGWVGEPITLHEGQILDGRGRYTAACRAGLSAIPTRAWAGEAYSPLAYLFAVNLHRRHLSTAQRALVAAQALGFLRQEAKKRSAGGGQIAGQGRSSAIAGRLTQVSRTSVNEANRVASWGIPELQEAVFASPRRIALHRGSSIACMSAEEQLAAVRAASEAIPAPKLSRERLLMQVERLVHKLKRKARALDADPHELVDRFS